MFRFVLLVSHFSSMLVHIGAGAGGASWFRAALVWGCGAPFVVGFRRWLSFRARLRFSRSAARASRLVLSMLCSYRLVNRFPPGSTCAWGWEEETAEQLWLAGGGRIGWRTLLHLRLERGTLQNQPRRRSFGGALVVEETTAAALCRRSSGCRRGLSEHGARSVSSFFA